MKLVTLWGKMLCQIIVMGVDPLHSWATIAYHNETVNSGDAVMPFLML